MTGFGASAPGEALYPAFRHHRPKRLPRRPARSYRSAEKPSGVDEPWRYGLRSTALAASVGWSCGRAYEHKHSEVEVVGINDLGPVETNAHLLRYDSVHGRFPGEITTGDNWMDIGRGKIRVTAERDPAKLPWRELGVDVALECTGIFTKREAAAKHLEAGAKRVIISAPADGADLTVVLGVNQRGVEARASGHLERLVHDQLPGAGRLRAASGDRHRARLHDDDPLLYRRPEPAGHAAQRSPPRPCCRAVDDPDLDRRGAGDRPRNAGAQRQARRHRDPRADRQCVADRPHLRCVARDHRRRRSIH